MSTSKKLIFVSMGMSYTPRFAGDVCNHRIRTQITNPKGRNFFIEVGTGRGDKMRIDHVIDLDQEREYKEKASYYREKISESKMLPQRHPLWATYQKYMEQPHQWYKYKEWESLNVEYTQDNVIKLVNRLFECDFTDMELTETHSEVFN